MKWFRKKKQFSKMVSVYISNEYQKIILAPIFLDASWIRYEQDEIETLNFDVNNEILGNSIKLNLNKFEEKNRDTKIKSNRKDWPAFKASELKTIKEFESKFSRITISGVNEANLILSFDAETGCDINLRTTISANAKNNELGIRLHKIYKAQIEKRIE